MECLFVNLYSASTKQPSPLTPSIFHFLLASNTEDAVHNIEIDRAEILRLEANDKALRELHALPKEKQKVHRETVEDMEGSIKDIWQQNIAGLSRKASKWVNESSFVRSDREIGGRN
ncbi:hypothetical protein XPA_006421 [Xanthoria parietina]